MIFKNRRLILSLILIAISLFIFLSVMKEKLDENMTRCVEVECESVDVKGEEDGTWWYYKKNSFYPVEAK